MTENNQISDEFSVELNPETELEAVPTSDPIGDRPDYDAPEADWVDYCVSLGADRHYLENETVHQTGGEPDDEPEVHPALNKDDLIELATRLGG